jgi:hypothetical protein
MSLKNGREQTGATIHLSAPWCMEEPLEHLKFSQSSFEEMGGTPIEHIAVQYA